jgi:ParB family chromosome partitioning protein
MPRQEHVHVSRIEPHPANPREELGDLSELAASIRVHGILQPLVIQVHPEIPNRYQLLAGHRRLAAAKLAHLDMVPVVVRAAADSNAAAPALEIMLVENCQRRDLGPMEKAEAMGALRQHGYTSIRIAKAIGISDATVAHYLALLDLDENAQAQVRSRELSAATAVAAVRKVRARERKKAGGRPSAMSLTWEPDYLSGTHPLARKAARLCEARQHNLRRRIGKTACGQCWETVIRQDEQIVCRVQAQAAFPPVRTDPELVDGPDPEWYRELATEQRDDLVTLAPEGGPS